MFACTHGIGVMLGGIHIFGRPDEWMNVDHIRTTNWIHPRPIKTTCEGS